MWWHDPHVWWRREPQQESEHEYLDAIGIMLMEMDVKLDRIVEAVEDDDGWEEEEEADGP